MSKTAYRHRPLALVHFRAFRRVWSPMAAFHLTRFRDGADWTERLCSAVWLAANHIPATGVPQT